MRIVQGGSDDKVFVTPEKEHPEFNTELSGSQHNGVSSMKEKKSQEKDYANPENDVQTVIILFLLVIKIYFILKKFLIQTAFTDKKWQVDKPNNYSRKLSAN